jgi:hypothetical protein
MTKSTIDFVFLTPTPCENSDDRRSRNFYLIFNALRLLSLLSAYGKVVTYTAKSNFEQKPLWPSQRSDNPSAFGVIQPPRRSKAAHSSARAHCRPCFINQATSATSGVAGSTLLRLRQSRKRSTQGRSDTIRSPVASEKTAARQAGCI